MEPPSETRSPSPARFLDTRAGRLAEIGLVFAVGIATIWIGGRFVGPDPLAGQGVVFLANVLMLGSIWAGLRARGQGWSHFGLRPDRSGARAVWGTVWRSWVVFVASLAAYVFGAIVMAVLVGRPVPADMSGYHYLSGNLPMLLVALVAVFLVSSIGEEVVYRGFLMTRLAEAGGGGTAAWRLAALGSAVLFGLIHYAWGPAGMVQTAFMGLALAIAYLAVGRRLWILILAHFYLDAILLIQMYLKPA